MCLSVRKINCRMLGRGEEGRKVLFMGLVWRVFIWRSMYLHIKLFRLLKKWIILIKKGNINLKNLSKYKGIKGYSRILPEESTFSTRKCFQTLKKQPKKSTFFHNSCWKRCPQQSKSRKYGEVTPSAENIKITSDSCWRCKEQQ